MRESVIEQRVCSYARDRGWLTYKWVSPANRGVPDRILFRDGRVLLIEFKAPGKRPTKLQSYIHQRLEKEGFKVHVIDSIEEGKRLVQ